MSYYDDSVVFLYNLCFQFTYISLEFSVTRRPFFFFFFQLLKERLLCCCWDLCTLKGML